MKNLGAVGGAFYFWVELYPIQFLFFVLNRGIGTVIGVSNGTKIIANSITGQYLGHTYRLVKESLTWDEAKTRAEELGGHLATITSAEENNVIQSLLLKAEKKFIT